MCPPSKNSFTIFASKLVFDHFHLTNNNVKACQSLGHHILALESNMEIFMEVLELLVEVATLERDIKHIHWVYGPVGWS